MGELQVEPEPGPQARGAVEADASPHQFHEVLGDGSAESTTPETPGNALIRLRELLKDLGLGLNWNADAGVEDLESDQDPP